MQQPEGSIFHDQRFFLAFVVLRFFVPSAAHHQCNGDRSTGTLLYIIPFFDTQQPSHAMTIETVGRDFW